MKHLRLLRFSRKTRDGKVSVELAEDMSDDWFREKIRMLDQALEKIRKALDYEKREFA